MPPARRRGGNQSTLSFGSTARVTKPSATTPVSQKAKTFESLPSRPAPSGKPSDDVAEPERVPVTPSEPSKPHIAEVVVREQPKGEIQPQREPWGEEDTKALELSEKDLQQYWKHLEEGRIAPRVHQHDTTLHEKILRHFDLSSQYGPCIGIARIKRWRRANMLNLHPPIEVLGVLLKDQDDVKQKAYMDELMS